MSKTETKPNLKELTEKFANKLDNRLTKVPHKDYTRTLIDLSNHCEVSAHIVYNWRTGRTFIKKSERVMIESFFNEKIF